MQHKILLLDDNANDLHSVSKLLTYEGYEVFPVSSYDNALAIVNNREPDIIITNWAMPMQDGKRIVEIVRSYAEIIDFVYIIVLTSKNQKIQAFEAGVDDFISKPVGRTELIARVACGSRIVELKDEFDKKCQQLLKVSIQLNESNRKNKLLASTDELTGLYNRREAMIRLRDAWSSAVRHDQELSCLYLDIDHFKSINDTHGHDIGDLALQHIAVILKNNTRRGEQAFRLGGEEFLIVCASTDLEGGKHAGERLREAVENSPLELKNKAINMTISVGVANRDKTVNSSDEILIKADAALYKAKTDGRNRICV